MLSSHENPSIKYTHILGNWVTPKVLEECSALYSNHYGVWSKNHPYLSNQRICLSTTKLFTWLDNNNADLYEARIDEELIGYAIAIKIKVKNYGIISWVTQLVVHEEYRKRDVAKTLLFSIWGLSNYFAWGLITANPFAVRALEKATRRRCSPARIFKNRKKLLKIGQENLTYVNEKTSICVNTDASKINTEFFVGHTEIDEMIKKASSDGVPWLLGKFDEGWEWFAFTFNDQEQLKLTKDEIEKMISASDEVTKTAYSRMILDDNHKWLTHTSKEVEFIVEVCHLEQGQSVLDVGCGIGRHSRELAKLGLNVLGVDYISSLIEKAEGLAKRDQVDSSTYMSGDFRKVKLKRKYDVVICLYDVIGSFIDDKENLKILQNIFRSLKPNGNALISVMNYEFTKHHAKNIFSFDKEPNKLLSLASAEIMEKTGDVFDPDHYIVDDETHIVYRKEQFSCGDALPTELIIRDKRYTKDEITKLCSNAGLEVQWAKYVGAGKWNDSLKPCESSAKEILLLCKKPVISNE